MALFLQYLKNTFSVFRIMPTELDFVSDAIESNGILIERVN